MFSNKTNKEKYIEKQKAFTLIELLVVIAIISILITVTLVLIFSAKQKAKDASFRSTVNSLANAMVMCCNKGGQIQTSIGGAVCNPVDTGTNYPDANALGSVNLSPSDGNHNCNANNDFQVTVTPGSRNHGNCNSATITQEGATFNGC